MANNTYGIVRPALINPSDAEIFYSYRPTRNSDDNGFRKWRKIDDVASVLSNGELEIPDGADPRLPGMYNLNLPISIFGKKGFYTVYIRPKVTTLIFFVLFGVAFVPRTFVCVRRFPCRIGHGHALFSCYVLVHSFTFLHQFGGVHSSAVQVRIFNEALAGVAESSPSDVIRRILPSFNRFITS